MSNITGDYQAAVNSFEVLTFQIVVLCACAAARTVNAVVGEVVETVHGIVVE